MRMRSSLFIGLCLSLAACTVSTASEPSGAGPEDPAAEGSAAKGANEANAAGESNTAEPGDDEGANALPSESAETDGGVDSGSSAKPEVDAGADAAPPKQTIPAPTKGFLHAYPTNGTCDFSIEGVYKSSGSALDVSLYADAYVIGCKHSSGKYVEDFAIIQAGKTTNLAFDFQIIPAPSFGMGTLVAVAVGGSCAFAVDGVSIGSGATVKELLKPGTYSVSCKPVSGATKSRSVTVTADNTAMAMFKL